DRLHFGCHQWRIDATREKRTHGYVAYQVATYSSGNSRVDGFVRLFAIESRLPVHGKFEEPSVPHTAIPGDLQPRARLQHVRVLQQRIGCRNVTKTKVKG